MLVGLAVGDALGVPVEFMGRETIAKDPVKGMRGYGTHNQPPGTWSDDSSLAFCLAETLIDGYDLNRIAKSFEAWMVDGKWTPHGKVFDVGIATSDAIIKLRRGVAPTEAGGRDELSNGNGSLMRIAPLVLYIREKDMNNRFDITCEVSSITHAHIRSVIACFYYLEFARKLLEGIDPFSIYAHLKAEVKDYLVSRGVRSDELVHFRKLLEGDIFQLQEQEIKSSGYVVDTLEASVWSLLTTGSYSDAVLRAVNLGEDTDTTGAVTGALAGLLYGYDAIPREWVQGLARREEIEALGLQLEDVYGK